MDQIIRDYIEEIESVGIQTKLSLFNTEVLVSQRNREIKLINEERNEKVKKLHEERHREIQKLREVQYLEIQKLREGQASEISRLRKEQQLAIEHLQREVDKRDRWIEQIGHGISELLASKRWKTGVAIGELYRKVLFKPQVPTVADHIQELIERSPTKTDSNNQPIITPLKKKIGKTTPRKALQFTVVPENPTPENPVTVIIPVYNAFEDVANCLESVLSHTLSPHEILLINDGSSDLRIGPLLQGYADNNPRVTLIENKQNLGYTRTINIGCNHCSTDVLLLNSDTIVTPCWVDRLRASAYQRSDIGTVTPVSNNAGAFSVPEINSSNEIPAGYTVDSYAGLISKLGVRNLPEIFTGSGFCLYIKRNLFDAVGFFDEVRFPFGYGEENDICLRAVKAGFKNVVDDGVYIYHRRTASFGNEKRQLSEKSKEQLRLLYPEFDSLVTEFQDNHPLHYVAQAVRNALPIDGVGKAYHGGEIPELRSGSHSYKQDTILFVVHDGGGGSVLTTRDLVRSIGQDYRCFLLVCGKTQWHLYDSGPDREIHEFNFDIPWDPVDPIDPLRLSMLKFICREFDISIVHIRSLIGLSPEVLPFLKYIGVKTVFSVHDLYVLCPTIHLIDNKGMFCGGHCSAGKGVCLISNKWYGTIPDLKHDYIRVWRKRMEDNLLYCDAFITTSQTTKDLIEKQYPGITKKEFCIIEHGRDIMQAETKAAPPDGDLIRVAVIGVSGAFKGALLLKSIIEQNDKHMKKRPHDSKFEFHIFGKIDRSLPLQSPSIVDHGVYERDLLPTYLDEAKPSFSIIPSIVPESYCHTLTESWSYGMPVFGSDIGAIRERILKHGGGWLLDYGDPEKWFVKMLEIAKDPHEYNEKIREIEQMHFKTVQEMTDEYVQVYGGLHQATQPTRSLNGALTTQDRTI
ncbi:MAG: glycosyltransferase [Syntrophales bacterium]|nr:glycosyltransferase [Syntrophales bacterium]